MLLETAPVGTVLEGTVRARVLAAAHMCGLRVQETPPDPRESDTWSEAFVCNALRLLQPVNQLECPSGMPRFTHNALCRARGLSEALSQVQQAICL